MDYKGKTFFITTLEKEKEGSLEARTYGDLAARSLESKGMVRAKDQDMSDFLVLFDYQVGGGKQGSMDFPVFVPGQTFTATTYTSRGMVTTQGTTPPRMESESIPVTSYPMKFTAAIYSRGEGGRRRAYELRATTVVGQGEFATVARQIIESAFEIFPIENGKTWSVTKPLNQRSSPAPE